MRSLGLNLTNSNDIKNLVYCYICAQKIKLNRINYFFLTNWDGPFFFKSGIPWDKAGGKIMTSFFMRSSKCFLGFVRSQGTNRGVVLTLFI